MDPQPPGRSHPRSPKPKESRRDGESRLHGKERAEEPRGPSHPQGDRSATGKRNPRLEGPVRWARLPLRRCQTQRRARTEPLPAAGPTGRTAARPAELREVPHGASGEGAATRTVGHRHCFLHWLRLGPRLLPSQSPASFTVEAALGSQLNSPLCCVHWCQRAPRAWGLWRPIQDSRGRPASRGVRGAPQSSAPRAESRRPSSCTISKHVDHRKRGGRRRRPAVLSDGGSHGPLEPETTPLCRLEGPGSCWDLGGGGGSVLPAGPGSQSGVSSAALGSGLGPPSGGRGCPAMWRLRGVSMEVDHPGR